MSLQTLFILRSVSHSLHSCVTGYFQVCQDYDFTHVGPRFNSQSFRIALARNVAVRQLNLCNHRDWLVDDTLQHVLEANCKLAKINLTGCSTLTSLTVLTLASCCPLLKELDLSNCHWLESEQFDLLASKCQDLERVSVSGCWNLNDDAIVALADACKRLAVLPHVIIYRIPIMLCSLGLHNVEWRAWVSIGFLKSDFEVLYCCEQITSAIHWNVTKALPNIKNIVSCYRTTISISYVKNNV